MGNFRNLIRESEKIIIIGVAGDSGSGKTTLTRGIRELIGEDIVSSFSLDDYHSLDREERKRAGITPLNPEANRLDLLEEHLALLKEGKTIQKPVYNHKTGKFDPPVPFSPTPIIIIEGLHPFYTKKLRELIDFKVFIDPSRGIKRKWKIKRDVEERGYKREDVEHEMMIREPDYKQYIDFQKIYADVVIKIYPSQFRGEELYQVKMIQRKLEAPAPSIEFSLSIASMLSLSERNFMIRYETDIYYAKRVGILVFDGELEREMFQRLIETIVEYTGKEKIPFLPPEKDYANAISLAQLLLCWRFMEEIKEKLEK